MDEMTKWLTGLVSLLVGGFFVGRLWPYFTKSNDKLVSYAMDQARESDNSLNKSQNQRITDLENELKLLRDRIERLIETNSSLESSHKLEKEIYEKKIEQLESNIVILVDAYTVQSEALKYAPSKVPKNIKEALLISQAQVKSIQDKLHRKLNLTV